MYWSPNRLRRGDFMPSLIGSAMLFASLPGFLMVLFFPDKDSQGIAVPLLLLLGFGSLAGTWLVVLGIRICSVPGSLTYRLTHGRLFVRRRAKGRRIPTQR